MGAARRRSIPSAAGCARSSARSRTGAPIDLVRREEARRRRTARDAAGVLPIPDVDELAIAIVTAEHVRAEVEQLPAEQREAIELAYFAGRTYRQVAEELGIPEGTAKSRMRLGLRRIADALAAKGMEHTWT